MLCSPAQGKAASSNACLISTESSEGTIQPTYWTTCTSQTTASGSRGSSEFMHTFTKRTVQQASSSHNYLGEASGLWRGGLDESFGTAARWFTHPVNGVACLDHVSCVKSTISDSTWTLVLLISQVRGITTLSQICEMWSFFLPWYTLDGCVHPEFIFYNYLHISTASLQAHYSVMSSVLLLARVQPSGVLVWKKPSWKMCAWCCRLGAQMQTR